MGDMIRSKLCPLCGSEMLGFEIVSSAKKIYRCLDCTHMFAIPQSVDTKAVSKVDAVNDDEVNGAHFFNNSGIELININLYDFALLIDNKKKIEDKFDICKLNGILEYSRNPVEILKKIHQLIIKGGQLLVNLPVIDNPINKKRKSDWAGFQSAQEQFFNRATIENVLCKCGFDQIKITTAGKNSIVVNCRAGDLKVERVISIIIPVYNEEKTIGILLDSIINKRFEGLQKEIIIIESNSTDSTRQIVESYAREHPELILILEDKPRGKGSAVRAGFNVATGDFIAIQDGDMEYDICDYDQLVIPLINYQKAFVLGSRHAGLSEKRAGIGETNMSLSDSQVEFDKKHERVNEKRAGGWVIRDFGSGKKLSSIYMNIGHIIFTTLINIGCGVKLKDPFTMYKLFRRECLYGLAFEGKRFEIDWEIVIKLIMKGYIPYEIPVSYHSRGFKEGKKVSIITDPFIWIISFVKYRFLTKPKKMNKIHLTP